MVALRGRAPGLKGMAETLLSTLGLADAELSILVCGDAKIRALNEQWRGKDESTDVLSFPQTPGPGPRLLGDIVISRETARREGTPLEVLLVHGLCHLLGHDHQRPAETRRMRAREVALLAAIGGGEGLVGRSTGR